jgi:hypothetical protein
MISWRSFARLLVLQCRGDDPKRIALVTVGARSEPGADVVCRRRTRVVER